MRSPVDLIEIDGVDAETLQAVLGFLADRRSLQIVRDGPGFVPYKAALGEDVGTLGQTLQRAADNDLGMSQTVDGRGIDPVHSGVQRRVNGGD